MTIAESIVASVTSPAYAETIRARHIMSTSVFTVDARQPAAEAAEQMLARGVSNAPVVATDFTRKFLVGIVSEKDFIQSCASGRLYRQSDLRVEDIMRPHPVAVRPEADLFSLAAIFMQHGFRHVPVVTGGVLDGIVSRRDVLDALLDHYREWQKLDPTRRNVPDMAGAFASRFLLG